MVIYTVHSISGGGNDHKYSMIKGLATCTAMNLQTATFINLVLFATTRYNASDVKEKK